MTNQERINVRDPFSRGVPKRLESLILKKLKDDYVIDVWTLSLRLILSR